jgi:uncharacterized phage-associated protein
MYDRARDREDVSISAPYEIKGLANLLLDWADEDEIAVTPMKLQKLLYFCHADYLCMFKKPLVHQDFEAWDFGPVEPSVFVEFRESSRTPIKSRALQFDPVTGRRALAMLDLCPDDLRVIRSLFDFYKLASATALSDMSHNHEGPWFVARRLFSEGRNADRRMPAKLIFRFHRKGALS